MAKARRKTRGADDVSTWLDSPDEPHGTPYEEGVPATEDAPAALDREFPMEGTAFGTERPGNDTEPGRVDDDVTGGQLLVAPGRRFVAFVLEAVLFIGTFGIGWLVWSMIEWREARTPAKRLLRDLTVVDAWSGERVGWRRMAVRELGAKIGLVGLFGAATFGLGWAIAGALVLSETRAALWDRLAGTTVVHPGG